MPISLNIYTLLNLRSFSLLCRKWQSIGIRYIELVIAAVLVSLYLLWGTYQSVSSANLLSDLRKNDFVFIDYLAVEPDSDHKYHFIPMKVLQVNGDNVVFKVGNIAYDGPVSPRQHVKFDRPLLLRNFYRTDKLSLTRSQLSQFFKDGLIYDVRRPDGIYIDGWIVLHEREAFVE